MMRLPFGGRTTTLSSDGAQSRPTPGTRLGEGGCVVRDWDGRPKSGIRFEWGPSGAAGLAAEAACLVVVDVLSFTTTVSIAVQKGIRVLPFRLPDGPDTTAERAAAQKAAAIHAQRSGARPAAVRSAVTADIAWSLSPAHLRRAPHVPRLAVCATLPRSAAGSRSAATALRSVRQL